jgi:2-keto-4-pentenoate hydratase/2-oxohepta-3-ene-1,7-dioic acid hydratase in catechol pathway
MDTQIQHAPALRPIHYDAVHRRLWINGQRCHHGATGALLTATAAVGAAVSAMRPARAATLIATGTVLMAHDWKDRPLWFERGWQDQP